MDSHKLKFIVNSFNNARQQVPEDGPGIIFIDLDISQLDEPDIVPYLDCMSASIQTLFSPTLNTRVGAVVLTTQPVFFQRPTPTGLQADFRVFYGVVHNMYLERLVEVPGLPNGKSFKSEYIGETTIDYGISEKIGFQALT